MTTISTRSAERCSSITCQHTRLNYTHTHAHTVTANAHTFPTRHQLHLSSGSVTLSVCKQSATQAKAHSHCICDSVECREQSTNHVRHLSSALHSVQSHLPCRVHGCNRETNKTNHRLAISHNVVDADILQNTTTTRADSARVQNSAMHRNAKTARTHNHQLSIRRQPCRLQQVPKIPRRCFNKHPYGPMQTVADTADNADAKGMTGT